jgi:hypothetical protein
LGEPIKCNAQDQSAASWFILNRAGSPKWEFRPEPPAKLVHLLLLPGERTTMTMSRRFTLQRLLPAIGLAGLAASLAKAEPQPHMRAALGHLRAARESLERAEPDKGGHRVKAIELVDGAIHHVEEGIAYANRH